jgi:hypothetical protein
MVTFAGTKLMENSISKYLSGWNINGLIIQPSQRFHHFRELSRSLAKPREASRLIWTWTWIGKTLAQMTLSDFGKFTPEG